MCIFKTNKAIQRGNFVPMKDNEILDERTVFCSSAVCVGHQWEKNSVGEYEKISVIVKY